MVVLVLLPLEVEIQYVHVPIMVNYDSMKQKQCLLLPHKLTKYSFLVVLQTGFHTRILIVSDCISSGSSQEENAGA